MKRATSVSFALGSVPRLEDAGAGFAIMFFGSWCKRRVYRYIRISVSLVYCKGEY